MHFSIGALEPICAHPTHLVVDARGQNLRGIVALGIKRDRPRNPTLGRIDPEFPVAVKEEHRPRGSARRQHSLVGVEILQLLFEEVHSRANQVPTDRRDFTVGQSRIHIHCHDQTAKGSGRRFGPTLAVDLAALLASGIAPRRELKGLVADSVTAGWVAKHAAVG